MKSSLETEDNFKLYKVELLPRIDNSNSYGNLLEKHKFTGHERDYSTGLDYMHFRFYASAMGRFLKPDNIIPDLTNPQNWNAYTYVKGNPVNFNDPNGHTEDQPLQQEEKQNAQPEPTQPATQNQEAMKKQEQKLVDQPKKVIVVIVGTSVNSIENKMLLMSAKQVADNEQDINKKNKVQAKQVRTEREAKNFVSEVVAKEGNIDTLIIVGHNGREGMALSVTCASNEGIYDYERDWEGNPSQESILAADDIVYLALIGNVQNEIILVGCATMDTGFKVRESLPHLNVKVTTEDVLFKTNNFSVNMMKVE